MGEYSLHDWFEHLQDSSGRADPNPGQFCAAMTIRRIPSGGWGGPNDLSGGLVGLGTVSSSSM